MIGMKNFFGWGIFRVVFFLLVSSFLTFANTGCEWWSDDDDNSSAGGVATAPAPTAATAPAPAPEAPAPEYPTLSGTGIVWKPISHSDKNLVILLPSNYLSRTSVAVLSPEGDLIENGRYVGRTNGNRPTFRFSRPGSGYPNGSLLRVGSKTYVVENTASRYN